MKRFCAVMACTAALGACATVDPQAAFVGVQQETGTHGAPPSRWARTPAEAATADAALDALLVEPLTAESSVQVALVNNAGLQATFEELGVSQADLAQAARVANPQLSAFVRFPDGDGGRNTGLSLLQNVLDVFVQPLRRKMAAAELEQAKLRVAGEVLGLAAEVKEAYFALLADRQLVTRLAVVHDVTETAGDLARAQYAAGTINALELENRTVVARQSKVDVAVAEADVAGDRERLNRLLGLWGSRTAWTVPDELPALPQHEVASPGLERIAVTERQDLRAARWDVDRIGRALALRKRTRFFPVGIQFGVNTEKDTGGERVTGPELVLQLPLFDTGKASVARLQAEHRRAQRRLEQIAVNARSEVREQHGRMQAARELTRYYATVLLPQRRRILELTTSHYNAMFAGAYDLLRAKQAEVDTERAHLRAWRDYWVARARLERALGGALPAAHATAGDDHVEGRTP